MTSDDLRFYLYLFVQRLPLMAMIGAVLSIAGLAYVVSLPPVYQATATILIESPQIPAKLAPVTETVGALTRLQIIQQEVLTHDAVLGLAGRHDFYPQTPELSPATIVDDLRSRIVLSPVLFGGSDSALGFSVAFEAADAQLAAQVANDLVSVILLRDEGGRSSRATATLTFFEEEARKLAQNVAVIEQRMQDYKSKHLRALPDTLEFRQMLQVNLRDRLLVLEREQSSLQNRRASYVEFYRLTGRVGDGAAAGQTPEQAQLAALNLALSSQRTLFAEESSAIVTLKTQISALEAKLSDNAEAQQGSSGTSALDLQLAELDDRLAAIELERKALDRNDAELTASIEATPANEAALGALERQHAVAQGLYDAASTRLAEASTGEQIESGLKGERLSLLEPARPPEKPTGPKRFRLALGVVAAAAAAALLVALGLELINRKVKRAIEIERALGIEVLATIPLLPVRSRLRFKLPQFSFAKRYLMGAIRP